MSVHYRKVWLISACAYFVSGKKLCAYYMYMRLLRVCKTRVLNFGPAQPKHYRTTMRAFLPGPPAVLYTDLHAVTCNLSKLNTGVKTRASHYLRACFALSAGIADYLATCM